MTPRLATLALPLLLVAHAASAQSGNAVVVVPVPITGQVAPVACPVPGARPRAADNLKGDAAVSRDKALGKTLSAQVLRDPRQLELQAGHWQ